MTDADSGQRAFLRIVRLAMLKIRGFLEARERAFSEPIGIVDRVGRKQRDCGWICPACGLARGLDGCDPCLGRLPGVTDACCGHAGYGDFPGYISFESGVVIRFIDAARVDGVNECHPGAEIALALEEAARHALSMGARL